MTSRELTILMVGHGSGGDVYPQIRLGKELKSRGHHVALIANEIFEGAAVEAGLEFIQLGTVREAEETMLNPKLWKSGRAARVFLGAALPHVQDVYRIISERYLPSCTVILAPFSAFGARIAHEKLGVPLGTIILQPIVLRSRNVQPGFSTPGWFRLPVRAFRSVLLAVLDKFVLDPVLAPRINEVRHRLGLAPVRRVFNGWMYSPQLVIGFFPEWFAAAEDDGPANTHVVGFPLPKGEPDPLAPELEHFLQSGEAPVVFTMGTAMQFAAGVFQVGVEACRRLGMRAIVVTRYPSQVPARLPPGVMHIPSAPFESLLPRCSVIVHHGGIGTMSQALASGIPQLIVPLSLDQPDNAARIRKLGTGDVVSVRRYNLGTTSRKLSALTSSPMVRKRCAEIAEQLRGVDSLSAAADLVEDLAAQKLTGLSVERQSS